jgi:hypothetical protein
MAWFDASDYFVLEAAAQDRVQDLEMPDEGRTDAPALFISTDRPRAIDRIIDYFGECPHRPLPPFGSARCVCRP